MNQRPAPIAPPRPRARPGSHAPGIAQLLWRGRGAVLAGGLCAALAAWAWLTFVSVSRYEAAAVVMIETRTARVVDLQSVMSGLSGDDLVVNSEIEVLRSRGLLGRVVDDLELGRDPEFNPALRPPGRVARLAARLSDWSAAQFGRPLWPGLGAAHVAPREAGIDTLRRRTRITVLPRSVVFQVVVTTTDPAKSARIANAIADAYMGAQLAVKADATARATAWLADQVEGLRRDLVARSQRLETFSTGTKLVDATALETQRRRLKALRERIAAIPPGTGAGAARRAALAAAVPPLEARIARQSADLVELEQLRREAEASRTIYQYFLGRLKETSVQQGLQQPDSRILSRAVPPRVPSAPQRGLLTVMAGMLGLCLGGGAVVARAMLRRGYSSAADLETATGVPVLGRIPRIRRKGRRRVFDHIVARPGSAAAEAVRNLRTSLMMAGIRQPQVVLCTSSLPGEGKTTLAIALARNLSGLDRRVLLIEGDVRRRVFGQYFGDPRERGLVAALDPDGGGLDTAVEHDPGGRGFDLLRGGEPGGNAADLFSGPGFAALIDAARAAYDIVVIDSPPVLLVPDARVIGRTADAILYAVQYDRTPRESVAEGLRLFQTARLEVTGMVLTQAASRGDDGYGAAGDYYRG